MTRTVRVPWHLRPLVALALWAGLAPLFLAIAFFALVCLLAVAAVFLAAPLAWAAGARDMPVKWGGREYV